MKYLSHHGAEDLSPQQVTQLQRNAAYEMARRSNVPALSYIVGLAVLILTSPFATDHPVLIYTVLGITVLAGALRFGLLLGFDKWYSQSPAAWDNSYAAAIIITALAWGVMTGCAVYFYLTTWTSLLTSMITATMCIGGLLTLGMRLNLSRVYLVLMLTPGLVGSLVAASAEGMALATVFLLYLVYCLAQSRHVNREYWESRINSVRLDAETKKRLHDLTYRDPLTGLPNRTLLYDRMQQAIRDNKRKQRPLSIMVLGLDRFKKINDTLGPQAGDELLRKVADRLQKTLREGDTVSRLSGDNFALILNNLQQANNAARIAQKLLQQMTHPFELEGLELFVTVSIGITVYPNDAEQPDELLKGAEAAMHRVKEQGGNAYQYYEVKINHEAMQRLQLETKLRRALEKDEFELYYQPKINLSSGTLAGFEALIRWCPPDSEPISPASFIPILEDTGLIVPVGEWVLRTACRQNKAWQQAGLRPVRMAVNLSARQFLEPGLADAVARVLDDTGLAPHWLELEITESLLMDHNTQNMTIINRLSDMGIHLAIDDFGTGYSSLSYLKRMPLNTLKVDRSFVKDITTDSNDKAVVQAIIAMAHSLKLRVVAEGVETAEQAGFLRDQHCDEVQGFHYSRPLPVHELESMFDDFRFCEEVSELSLSMESNR